MTPEKNQNLGTKINHSGNAPDGMREVPVNEFDNTPLQDAVDRGLVGTPDFIPTESNYTPRTDLEASSEKKRFTKKQKIIAALSGVALLAGIGGSIAASNMNGPDKSPVAEAPADPTEAQAEPETPSESETPASPEAITVESLEISNTLTPEQLGTLFVEERLSAWDSMGTTEDTLEAYITSGGDVNVIDETAAKNAELMAEALLVPNWKDIPALAYFVDANTQANESSIELWMKTSDTNRNEEPYKRWIESESVTSFTEDNGTLTITIDATSRNNVDKNRAGEIDPATLDHKNEPVTIVVAFQDIDGKYKMSSIDIMSR